MKESTFEVPKMDCPSEERLIRIALEGRSGIRDLAFDLDRRRLTVRHEGGTEEILRELEPLRMGARLSGTRPVDAVPGPEAKDEAAVLKWLLAINAAMFAVELAVGIAARSAGLIADSLDMLADAAVYGISLYAVGRAASTKARAARFSGLAQAGLATGLLMEVGRRFVFGSDPEPAWMMAISVLALFANIGCMALISRHREGGVHMQASWIFSTNDVLANIGVLAAGALVAWTGSHLPDLFIGFMIAMVVFAGAIRIFRLARRA